MCALSSSECCKSGRCILFYSSRGIISNCFNHSSYSVVQSIMSNILMGASLCFLPLSQWFSHSWIANRGRLPHYGPYTLLVPMHLLINVQHTNATWEHHQQAATMPYISFERLFAAKPYLTTAESGEKNCKICEGSRISWTWALETVFWPRCGNRVADEWS